MLLPQIAVEIIVHLRDAVDRISELRDPIQGIWPIDRLLSERIDSAPQSPRRIEHPLRLPIQRIFHRDQIVQFIGERGDVVERVFDRERLTLRIHREGRDFIHRIGDRREIPLVSYPNVVVWLSGSVTVASSAGSSNDPYFSAGVFVAGKANFLFSSSKFLWFEIRMFGVKWIHHSKQHFSHNGCDNFLVSLEFFGTAFLLN